MENDEGGNFVAMRRHIRAQLLAHGLQQNFCDDDTQALKRIRKHYEGVSNIWLQSCRGKESLILKGLSASSTDMEEQGIENTLYDNHKFWSSTGSQHTTAEESLLYMLKGPLCRVKYLCVALYRAYYQHGQPIYPPEGISFELGPSPSQLYPASPVYEMQRSDIPQAFALSPDAAPARYLLIRLHGKLQRQLGDDLYYHAVRCVSAHGDVMPVPDLFRIMRSLPLTTGHAGCSAVDTQQSSSLLTDASSLQRNSQQETASSSYDAESKKQAGPTKGQGRTSLVGLCTTYLLRAGRLARSNRTEMKPVVAFSGDMTMADAQQDADNASTSQPSCSVSQGSSPARILQGQPSVSVLHWILLCSHNHDFVREPNVWRADNLNQLRWDPMTAASRSRKAAKVVERLVRAEDYHVDNIQKCVRLTEEGFEAAEDLLHVGDLYEPDTQWATYILDALQAKEFESAREDSAHQVSKRNSRRRRSELMWLIKDRRRDVVWNIPDEAELI